MITNEKGIIDIREASEILGISQATLRNWIKLKHIEPVGSISNNCLLLESILNLKQKISDNENGKLKGRANKKTSTNSFIPTEYLGSSSIEQVERLLTFFSDNQIKIQEAVFISSILFLKDKGLVNQRTESLHLNSLIDAISHKQLKQEMLVWLDKLDSGHLADCFPEAMKLQLSDGDDILGILYQSLQSEGNKSIRGSYYTPIEIIKSVAETHINKQEDNVKILDPCCGTGQFLLAIAQHSRENGIELKPNNLWGADIDDIAVRLARINLLVKYKDVDFTPNIHCIDTLLDSQQQDLFNSKKELLKDESFDFVVTNPPWGADLSKEQLKELKKKFTEISSGESFSYFLIKSIQLLKNKGILSFILPESFLNVKTHSDVRNYVLAHCKILKIVYLNRVFKNVFTPVIRIDLRKDNEKSDQMVEIIKNQKNHFLPQNRFKNNQDSTFDIHTKNEDIEIIDKVFQVEHTTLLNNADWALGIVTGDNKKYLQDVKEKGQEEIIRGKDLDKFFVKRKQCFIDYQPNNFQQVAPEYKYRAKEKLIYKFISKNIVFAYDDNKLLTLNSANILIPKLENYPIKVILALFNSTLYQFIFKKLNNGSIKILRSHLEQLPLPLWSKSDLNKIEELVNDILKSDTDMNRQKITEKLDDTIMDKFELSKSQKNHIKISI